MCLLEISLSVVDAKIIPPEPPGPNLPHGELSIGEISGEMCSSNAPEQTLLSVHTE
jgi:hypothetical protein